MICDGEDPEGRDDSDDDVDDDTERETPAIYINTFARVRFVSQGVDGRGREGGGGGDNK